MFVVHIYNMYNMYKEVSININSAAALNEAKSLMYNSKAKVF